VTGYILDDQVAILSRSNHFIYPFTSESSQSHIQWYLGNLASELKLSELEANR
jgi:hypothetical protein